MPTLSELTLPQLMGLDPFERAAWRTRESVQPTGGRPESYPGELWSDPLTRAAGEWLIPQTPLDAGLMALTGPWGKIAKLMGLGIAAALQPTEAEAGPLSKLLGLVGRGETMASRSPMLYNSPVKPARPFSADYSGKAPADAAGRLAADIEGRPLDARWVVGRQVVGGDDVAFPQAELDALAEATTGRGPQTVPARQMGQDAGRLVLKRDWVTGQRTPEGIELRSSLSPTQAERVLGHELGHAIDELAGQIPVAGLNTELRQLYDTMASGRERTRNLTGPQHQGYRSQDVPRELVTEAIRAYMADPNYIKTVAPKTAAVIRERVNSHPTLRKIIQFNAVPLAAGAVHSSEDD